MDRKRLQSAVAINSRVSVKRIRAAKLRPVRLHSTVTVGRHQTHIAWHPSFYVNKRTFIFLPPPPPEERPFAGEKEKGGG